MESWTEADGRRDSPRARLGIMQLDTDLTRLYMDSLRIVMCIPDSFKKKGCIFSDEEE